MSKKFWVRFYAASIHYSAGSTPGDSFFDLCLAEADRQQLGSQPSKVQIGSEHSELRNLVVGERRDRIHGVLAKLRMDAPSVRLADGGEESLDLNEGESLLEKNHFILFKRDGLVVWQTNKAANHQSRFARMIEGFSGNNGVAALDDVLSANAVQALNSGRLRKVDVKLRCPDHAVQDPYDFGDGALSDLAGATPGAYLTVSLSVGKQKRTLDQRVTSWVRDLLPGTVADRAEIQQLRIKTDEHAQPIDLLAETVKGTVSVNMIGLYPDPQTMFHEMNRVLQDKRNEIETFFQSDSVLE